MEVTYKNTDIGIFAADWDIKTIAQLFDKGFQNGVFYEVDRKGKGVPIVNVSDLYGNIPIVTHSLEKFNATDSEINRFLVHKGDLFFTRSSVVPAGIAMCNVYDGTDEDNAVFDSHVIKLSVDQNKIDSLFLCMQCRMPYSRRFFIANSKTAIMTTIDQKSLAKCPIPIPSLPEQNDIVETLRQFDTYIDDLSELIEKKRGIRDGALEDLTSGHTRLSGFKDNWEIIELGKKCEITSSKRVFEKEWTKSGITFLRTRDIASFHSGEKQNDKLYISEETYKEKIASSGEPQKGDLLVTGVGTIGLPFLIDNDEKIYFKDGNILWIKKNEMLTSEWLYFLFLSKAVQRQIADNSGFTTVGTFTIKNAKKLRVPMPSISEQKAITSVLISMNDEIKALETKRDKMIQIREGAMDNLLTGRVRLIV